MLNRISVGKYYNIKSAIHDMNPTSKIICALIFFIAVVLASDFQLLTALSLLTFIIIILGRLPSWLFINQIYSLRYIIIFLIFVYYANGYAVGSLLMLILKLILILSYAAIITLTTKPTEITTGLEEFFAPLTIIKIPVASLALFVSLTLRFLPTAIEQMHKIVKALAARGIDYYNSGLIKRIKALKVLSIPTFVLSSRRTKQMAAVMKVRLYNFEKKRTNYNAKEWGVLDGIMIVIHIGIFVYMTLGRYGLV